MVAQQSHVEDYSTLEVLRPLDKLPGGSEKVLYDELVSYPEAVNPDGNFPAPASYPRAGSPGDNLPEPVIKPRSHKTILGLSRRALIVIVALLLFLLVCGVAGAVGGVLASRKSHDGPSAGSAASPSTSPSPFASSPAASAVLSNSNLAAINYTLSSSGPSYRMLFWQHRSGDLMLSLWDSANASWASPPTNITAALTDSASSPPSKVLPGTPLAAAARAWPWTETYDNAPFGIALFYLSAANTVQEVYSTDLRGGAWQAGDLLSTTAGSGIAYQAGDGSQLAAWWQLCDSALCSGDVALWFEDGTQALQLANSSDWAAGPVQLASDIEPASGIGVAVVSSYHATYGSAAASPRVYYYTSEILQEIEWQEGAGWNLASVISHLPSGSSGSSSSISAMGFANASDVAAGPQDLMVVPRFANGSVVINYWDNSTWHFGCTPTVTDNTTAQQQGGGQAFTNNFTASALLPAEDLMFFGISSDGGQIQAYTIDRTAPLLWSLDAVVGTG